MSKHTYQTVSERDVPQGLRFDTPRSNAGQMIEVAYGTFGRGEAGEGDEFRRVTDRSAGGRVTYERLVRGEG